MQRAARILGLVVLALVSQSGLVHAQKMKILDLKLVEPKADDKKGDQKGDKKAKAVYHAVVDYAVPGLAADKFQLKDVDAEPPVSAPADKVITFPESTDKLALVVLVQGDQLWMGNDTYVPAEDPDQLQGAFSGLPDALGALSKAGPAGSTGSLLIYAGGQVTPKFENKGLEGLSGALGTQQDYTASSVPLIAGIDQAYKALTEMSGRRVLVVFGDGTDAAGDISEQLGDRVKKLQALDVETYTIYYSLTATEDPTPKNNFKLLGYTNAYEATLRDNFKSKAEDIVASLAARYYIDFPAQPFATKDKHVRELTLFIGDAEGEPRELATIKLPAPPEESSLWWLWLLVILIIVVVVIVIVVKLKNREPAPPPVFEAPPPEPASASPAKTIMLGIGGNDEGFPIVGWVVPVTGPNQYQTFKLHQGQTVLGTGGDAHVVVNDTFMSTLHAEIVCTATGFTLKDLGSTNGTFVNQRKVDAHELFDNDVFTLGKTDFKFKSIN